VSVFYLCIASLPYFHSITGNFLLLLTTVSRRRIYPLAPQCLMDAFYYCYHSLLFPFSDSHHRYGKIRRLCDQILVICPFCLLELLSNTNMALKTKKITGDWANPVQTGVFLVVNSRELNMNIQGWCFQEHVYVPSGGRARITRQEFLYKLPETKAIFRGSSSWRKDSVLSDLFICRCLHYGCGPVFKATYLYIYSSSRLFLHVYVANNL
jgi:hypothetical protein